MDTRLRIATLGTVLASLISAATCAPPSSPTSAMPRHAQPRPSPSAAPPTSAVPIPSASASASASASPSASASASAPALPIRSATPGKVQCGAEDCDLSTDFCCGGGDIGCCTASKEPIVPCDASSDRHYCDESADCPKGQQCCRTARADDNCIPSEQFVCTSKKCGRTAEVSNEVCLPGAWCANGPCVVAPGQREGSCPLEAAPLACGSARCKPGESCCWDPAKKTGTCLAGNTCPSIGGSSHRFACLRPSDCGAGLDCYNGSGSSFFTDYDCGRLRCSSTILVAGPVLCESLTDCPWLPRAEPDGTITGIAPRSCQPDKDMPPGVKSCRYR